MFKEDEYMKEDVVRGIIRKLEGSNILTPYEFQCVNTALRKVKDIKQTPYYEVVYHDEYDRTGHIRVRQDHFELNFNRLLQ